MRETRVAMEKTRIVIQPNKPHFFKPILSVSEPQLSIPISFMGYLKGEKPEGESILWSGNILGRSWKVKVVEGRLFKDGWDEFAEAHSLNVGDFLVFRQEKGWVFHVMVFDSTACQKEYPPPLQHEEPKSKHKKEEAPSFTVTIRPYHFNSSVLHIPAGFARSNNLRNKNRAINFKNDRRSWQVNLRYNICDGQTYIAGGLKTFLDDNRLNVGDSCCFKLVSNGKNVVFEVTFSRSIQEEEDEGEEEDDNMPSFMAKIQRYNFNDSIMCIPKKFARSNGLMNRLCIVTLKDEKGRRWKVDMRYKRGSGQVYIRRGWPKFLKANKLRRGDICNFQLVVNGKKVVFKVTISRFSA